jgi:hypothetical protein
MRVAVVIERAGFPAERSATTLKLGDVLTKMLERKGIEKIVYTADVCATKDGIVARDPTHPTGFPELNAFLHREIGALAGAIAPDTCAVVTLILSHKYECSSARQAVL